MPDEIQEDQSMDAKLGMQWWNGSTEAERARWLKVAGSAIPAEAWEAYKRDAGMVATDE